MVLDTNILIAYLDKDVRVIEAVNDWFSRHVALFISAVTYTELLALPEASPADLAKIQDFLDYFVVIDVDKNIAETTAALKRKYKLKFPDAAIAATAIRTRTTLVTRDRQMRRIKEIQFFSI